MPEGGEHPECYWCWWDGSTRYRNIVEAILHNSLREKKNEKRKINFFCIGRSVEIPITVI